MNDTPGRGIAAAIRAMEGETKPVGPSLFDQANQVSDVDTVATDWPTSEETRDSWTARAALQPDLDELLTTFCENDSRDTEAFGVFCAQLWKKVSESPAGRILLPRHRRQLLGLYVEAAAVRTRSKGRPSSGRAGLFLNTWMQLHEEGRAPFPYKGLAPARAIAQRLAEQGRGDGFDERTVSKALERFRASLDARRQNHR